MSNKTLRSLLPKSRAEAFYIEGLVDAMGFEHPLTYDSTLEDLIQFLGFITKVGFALTIADRMPVTTASVSYRSPVVTDTSTELGTLLETTHYNAGQYEGTPLSLNVQTFGFDATIVVTDSASLTNL